LAIEVDESALQGITDGLLNSFNDMPWGIDMLNEAFTDTSSFLGHTLKEEVSPNEIPISSQHMVSNWKVEQEIEASIDLNRTPKEIIENPAPISKPDVLQLALQLLKRPLAPLELELKKEGEDPMDPPMKRLKCETKQRMDSFPPAQVSDWKHVLYNLLVENHNSGDDQNTLLKPVEVMVAGQLKRGFRINPAMQPRQLLAEMYATHVRKESLHGSQGLKPVLLQDLYKHYLRAAYQLMSKYFNKVDQWTYVYGDIPLFVSGETLAEASDRLKLLDTKQRRQQKRRLMGN
jgi:hypothetical protein